MRVEPLSSETVSQWEAFVNRHPWAWLGHLQAIARLESATSDTLTRSIIAFDDRGNVLGVLPLFVSGTRDLRVVKSRVLSTGTQFPSGPLIDVALPQKTQREVQELLVARALTMARELHVDRCVINYPSLTGDMTAIARWGYYPLRPYGFHERNVVSLLVDLSPAEAELFAGLKSNCRNMVKRAAKDGGAFEVITERDRWLGCEELSRQTLGASSLSQSAMAVIWDELVVPGHATVTAVSLHGRLVSVAVIVGLNTACYYWLGFNAKPQPLTGANNFVLWHAMLHWKARGARFFEVGSLEFSDDKMMKIAAFKESFGGVPFYCLGGSVELRPVKRRTIDLADTISTAIRRRKAPARDVSPEPREIAEPKPPKSPG